MFGLAVTIVLMMIFTFFVLIFMENSDSVRGMTVFSLASGSFASGLFCGRYRRRNGLFEGVLCGVIIFSVLTVSGIVFVGNIAEIFSLKKLLLTTSFGGAGGAIGVNLKRPRNL